MTRPRTSTPDGACEAYAERLAVWVDTVTDDPDPARLEAHLDRCPRCRQLLADLREIKQVAATLGPVEPSERVWRALERQLAPRSAPPRSRSPWVLAGAGAAAGLLLAVVVHQRMGTPVVRPVPPPAVERIDPARSPVEEAYTDVIDRLEALAVANESSLRPGRAALARGLAVVDEAIVESRQALAADPGHPVARARLHAGLRRKISLLRAVAISR